MATFSTSAGNNSSTKKKSKTWKRASSLKWSLLNKQELSIFNSDGKFKDYESDDSVRNEFWFYPKNYVFHSIKEENSETMTPSNL